MRSLSWYIKRASVMGPREAFHRIREHVVLATLRSEHSIAGARFKKVVQSNDFRFCTETSNQLPALSWSFHLPDDETVLLLEGQWPALGFPWQWKPDAYLWNRAPDTGKVWPSVFFGLIPYHAGNPFGDIRVAWEPSRLQQLVSLALLAHQETAHAEQAIGLLENILASWIEANPPLTGIHYVSAMECALRLIAACHALDMVRTKLSTPEQTWACLLQLVMSHAGLIVRRLSLYSSAGNHTIAEACGLVYAGTLFPEFSDANHWKTVGMRLLEQEAARQIFSDGGNIEQALGYQVFIIDLLGLVQLLLEDRCEPIPAAISNAVRGGRMFLMTFGQNRKDIPSIGDQDGGYALSRHLEISWKVDLNPRLKYITFSDSGYTVLYSHLPSIQFVFDHGPLGMTPCFAHGHADALSVVLNCCDREMLIDPGTFTYTGDTLWRTYFRGTRAHNTVTVDNLDQAVQETAFMWSEPFHSQVVFKEESSDSAFTILAFHNGYAKRVGVTHWRAVLFNPPATWLIWDRVTGYGVHHLELNWHLGTEPNAWADRYTLPGNGNSLCLAIEGGITTVHCGETDPVSGWRSRQYGMKEPISTIRTVFVGSLPHEFLTRIWVGVNQTPPELTSDKLAELRRLTS